MHYVALASVYDGAGETTKAVEAYFETIRWSRLAGNPAGLSGMTHWLIGALWNLGRLKAAEQACGEALQYLEERGMARLPIAGLLHVRLSGLYLEYNNLAAAEEHLALGTELGKWSGRFDSIRNTAPTLVRLKLVQHDFEGALAAVSEANLVIDAALSPQSKAELYILRAKILVRQGSCTEAAQCVEEAAKLIGSDRGQAGDALALAVARVACAQARPEKALITLTRSLESAEVAGRWGVALELRILRSLVRERLSDTRGATADLERALTIGEPEGYQRIFIDEGEPMQLLLVKWLAHTGASPLRAYANQLLAQVAGELSVSAAEPAVDSPNGGLAEPLSQRELEVLQLMALGKTNPDIARQLYLAPGTIKAHAAAIYRKLDAANRTEAVSRARELRILA